MNVTRIIYQSKQWNVPSLTYRVELTDKKKSHTDHGVMLSYDYSFFYFYFIICEYGGSIIHQNEKLMIEGQKKKILF